MTSVIADGAFAVSVKGDFDDCQALVKTLFNDHQFRDQVGPNLIAELMVIEQGFDERLTIVKIALNRNRKSTISNHRCHLPLLHWRDTAVSRQCNSGK